MSDSNTDRNLLFGILALQFNFITQENLVSATHEWVGNKSKSLDEILLERKMLGSAECDLLRSLLEKQAQLHDGDLCNTLEAISSISSVREELEAIGDGDVNATLSFIASAPRQPGPRPGDSTLRESTDVVPTGRSGPAHPRFRVLRRHAKGGLGEVLVAEDTELNRNVALKQIREDLADDEVSRTRFVMEAEVTGGLEHPGIVPVYGLGQYANGRPFYAMRFVKGDSLREAVQQYHTRSDMSPAERNLSLRGLLGRFVDVCQAVEYAHSRGVLHRDLKPGNIMLGKFGETLVVDWGLAKVIDRPDLGAHGEESCLTPRSGSGSTPTAFGAAIGTPAFMSPEQAAGRVDDLGPASDVYCLGATLYFVLVGKPPQKPTADEAELLSVQGDEPPNPRHKDHSVPKPLASICMKAMASESSDRYPSPAKLADEIERWLGDEPVRAHPETLPARASRWVRRHYSLVSSVVVVTLLAAIGLAFVAWKTDQARRQVEEQKSQAEAARAEAERHFNRSLDAVEVMLHRVGDERLVDVPQFSVVRKEILQDALTFYSELLEEQPAREDVQFLTGRGHQVLGEIYFLLGEADRAVSHMEQGRQILQNGSNSHAVAHRLGRIQLQLGEHYLSRNQVPQAMAESERAQKHLGSLPESHIVARLSYVDVLTLQGQIHRNAGRIADALQAYSQAADELKSIGESETRDQEILYRLQAAYHNRAMIHTEASHADSAIRDYQIASTFQEELRKVADDQPAYMAERANTAMWLGNTHSEMSNFSEAISNFDQAVLLLGGLSKDFPSIRRYQIQLAAAQNNRAAAYRDSHDLEEALKGFGASIRILNQLSAEGPLEPHEKSDLAGSHGGLAWLLASIGKLDEAENHLRTALALHVEVAEQAKGTVKEVMMLAAAYHNHASILQRSGKLTLAIEDFRKSIETIQTIEQPGGKIDQLRHDEANSWLRLAEVNHSLGNADDADEAYQTANRLFHELTTDNPSIPRFVIQYAASYHNYAEFQRQHGRAEEALGNVRESIRILGEIVDQFEQLAFIRRDLASSQFLLGNLLLENDQPDAAKRSFEASEANWKRLNQQHPGVPDLEAGLDVARADV